MTTNFEYVPINDNTPTTAKVGGQTITQGADNIFHQTAIPLSSVIEEATGVTLSTGDTDIALDGTENYVMLDMGTNDPTGTIIIQLQYSTGGDFYAAEFFPAVPSSGQINNLRYVGSQLAVNGQGVSEQQIGTNSLDGSRILYVPTMGAKTCRVKTSASTLAGTAWRRLAMQPPMVRTYGGKSRSIGLAFNVLPHIQSGSAYTAGDVMGSSAQGLGEAVMTGPSPGFAGASPVITSLRGADYGGVLSDCDLIIFPHLLVSDVADDAALDIDYPEGVIAWYEIRGTPTGNQIKLQNYGATGGTGFSIPETRIEMGYLDPDAGGAASQTPIFDFFLVDRASITGTAGTFFYLEASVEL